MNSEIEIKLRRHKKDIVLSAHNYIIFGIWNIVKILMVLTMSDTGFSFIVEESIKAGVSRKAATVILIIMMSILVTAIFVMHFLVGIRVVRYSEKRNKKIRFFILLFIVTAINISGLAVYPVSIFDGTTSLDGMTVASFLVDLSVVVMLLNIIYSAITIEKLTKKKNVEKGNKNAG